MYVFVREWNNLLLYVCARAQLTSVWVNIEMLIKCIRNIIYFDVFYFCMWYNALLYACFTFYLQLEMVKAFELLDKRNICFYITKYGL